ncbi:hypothetical protein NDU88_002742 [Pleurodeles waltl]|uniref:Uncharacterized protein n=1 Tax=Pleurodeles waltl TaxID=8319 RepID=A0AAV7LDD0_PLEWA|nr:hypothetical protein NDU88_002742 [Pleurodeles waltl]
MQGLNLSQREEKKVSGPPSGGVNCRESEPGADRVNKKKTGFQRRALTEAQLYSAELDSDPDSNPPTDLDHDPRAPIDFLACVQPVEPLEPVGVV